MQSEKWESGWTGTAINFLDTQLNSMYYTSSKYLTLNLSNARNLVARFNKNIQLRRWK